MPEKKFSEILRFYGPLVVWMVVIFCFSAREGSGNEYYDLRMFVMRKSAHIVEYAILAYFCLRALNFSKFSLGKSILWTIFITTAYAISDEFHQVFVYGRQGKISDVGFDLIGVMLASSLYYFRFSSLVNKKDK